MAMEGRTLTTGSAEREKQVNVQIERLSKSVDELKQFANILGSSLAAIISPHAVCGETDEEATTPQASLCTHAEFLRSRVCDINKVIGELNDLVHRIEI